MIRRERTTAIFDGDVVVFLVGMRVNTLWKIPRWFPVVRAKPRMLAELQARPDS